MCCWLQVTRRIVIAAVWSQKRHAHRQTAGRAHHGCERRFLNAAAQILFMCLTSKLRLSTLSLVTSFMRYAGFAAGQGAWTPQLHGLLHPAISEGGTSVRCSHWGKL